MADMTEIKARLEFRKKALQSLREAYIALVDGRVKSYTIGNRELTRFDLDTLKNEISELEKEVDNLTSSLSNKKPRKAFGIIPRDW